MTTTLIFWVVIVILALLVGALTFFFAKSKGKTNPDKWFVGGFVAVILAAIAIALSNKKR
ncbi:MAG: hypothetical protein ACM3PZ_03470 [Bacillota bacterium]